MAKTTTYSNQKSVNTLEKGSFGDFGDETPARQVITGDFYLGKHYDRVDVAYPTSKIEVFTYTLNAVTTRIVTITYVNSSKDELVSVVVS